MVNTTIPANFQLQPRILATAVALRGLYSYFALISFEFEFDTVIKRLC